MWDAEQQWAWLTSPRNSVACELPGLLWVAALGRRRICTMVVLSRDMLSAAHECSTGCAEEEEEEEEEEGGEVLGARLSESDNE